ncbi:MAG: hypothetical protein U0228_16200 [Myxococcaceae bacterium]
MVDYRKFLGKTDTVVAPFLGGRSITLEGRQVRLATVPPKEGWYRFELKGRLGHVVGEAEAPSLEKLPRVRGFAWRDRLVGDGARAEPLRLRGEEDPARFAPLTARRWYGGELLFEGVDFETGAESEVREAFANGTGLATVKNVPAPLRAAFAFALIERAARDAGVPVAASEVRGHTSKIADGGFAAAQQVVRDLIAEREQTEREMAELRARIAAHQLKVEVEQAKLAQQEQREKATAAAEDRAWAALEKAGAKFESSRRAGQRQLEVVFEYLGERFICLCDEFTLQVIDSGICLGHPPADDLITLESLPAVIKEAVDTHRLVILRAP